MNKTNTIKICDRALDNVSTQSLMLLCCVYFETYSVIQRSNSASRRFFHSLVVQCWRLYRSLVGKYFFCCCLRLEYNCKRRSWCKKPERFACSWLFEIWFERVPAWILCFSSFRIFSPLCCCSRVRPVDFFNFSFLFTKKGGKKKKRKIGFSTRFLAANEKINYITLNSEKVHKRKKTNKEWFCRVTRISNFYVCMEA